MSFDFFTCGGKSRWGDIFFYQKWRIQRHINAKDYRLLDNWDICRKEGSFEECRKKFIDCIEAYQISRQKGHMIVMLHGIGETKKIFRPLWREAAKRNFVAAALNYPSTNAPLDSHVKQLDFFLNHIEDITDVSFVAKGESCLILRHLFSLPSPWQKKLKIHRILFINPKNNGNDFVAWLSKFWLFRWMFGPMAEEISSDKTDLIAKLPQNIEQGTIFCDSKLKRLWKRMTRRYESIPLKNETTEESYVVKSVHIENNKKNPLNNEKVIETILNFLEKGVLK